MDRRHHFALVSIAAVGLAGWLALSRQDAGPTVEAESAPVADRVDPIASARDQEVEQHKTQSYVQELARIEAERKQREHSLELNLQARSSLQAAKNGIWSAFMSTNWAPYQKLHEAAVNSPSHKTNCN